MTTAVQSLLDSFERLSENERQQAAVEILRRLRPEGELSEQALVEVADELFTTLDREEAADADRGSR
jgi:predicted HAD superfamily phosphohydrolase